MWYRLVGSAVEHAAKCVVWTDPGRGELPAWEDMPEEIDFRALFLNQEASDEDETDLGETLNALAEMAGCLGAKDFRGSDVAKLLNDSGGTDNAIVIRSYLFPSLPPDKLVSAKSISKQLKMHAGEPVKYGGQILVLRAFMDTHDKNLRFCVVPL
jgi:hypothetical protein